MLLLGVCKRVGECMWCINVKIVIDTIHCCIMALPPSEPVFATPRLVFPRPTGISQPARFTRPSARSVFRRFHPFPLPSPDIPGIGQRKGETPQGWRNERVSGSSRGHTLGSVSFYIQPLQLYSKSTRDGAGLCTRVDWIVAWLWSDSSSRLDSFRKFAFFSPVPVM